MNSANLRVIYEDNHLLAVNKPSGLLVQGDETGDIPLVDIAKDYLKKKYNKPGNVFCGVIHRIDRPVSGLVLMAKTSKALTRMNEQFKQRDIKKTYLALVSKKPLRDGGKLIHWLTKDTSKNISKAYNQERPDALRAELDYDVVSQSDKAYLLEVFPLTGRPHQIRVQLAAMGCPIVGDLKYGYPSPNSDASICLHALRLKFAHPVSLEEMHIEAGTPDWV
ncbi:MAG: RluA family pseudouridine synthase [Flavobacteriaceae bacterium]|nr:RluA family pseudouridine synthase [Flavobacteriaceae bacterium]